MNEAFIVGTISGAVAGAVAAVVVILAHEGWPGRRGVRIYRDRGAATFTFRASQRSVPPTGPMGPFDRFNDRAKRVLALAQDEAIRFNPNYIGTEHLLLGLVREGEGIASGVLESLGVSLEEVRYQVIATLGQHPDTPPTTAPQPPAN